MSNIKGQVIKVISDDFTVLVDNDQIICKQRGKLRNLKTLPLVGDFVLIDREKQVIEEILPRQNRIVRPPVANVTRAIIVTSFKNPDFSTNLLDKLIVQLEINNIQPVICLTKRDLINEKTYQVYQPTLQYYQRLGYPILDNQNLDDVKKMLENNTTVLIGQTGAGKSTLLNRLFTSLNLKTGEVSLALGRGKHTTRHVEILLIDNIRVLDTPGFSALSFMEYTKKDIRDAFLEFKNYPCIYKDCMHIKEEECMVKKAVLEHQILESRYQNYLKFMEEWEKNRRF